MKKEKEEAKNRELKRKLAERARRKEEVVIIMSMYHYRNI